MLPNCMVLCLLQLISCCEELVGMTKDGSSTVVITDRAPVCPRLCKDHKLKYLIWNHSKGISGTKKRSETALLRKWTQARLIECGGWAKCVYRHQFHQENGCCDVTLPVGYAFNKAISWVRPRQRKKGRAKNARLTTFSHNRSKIRHGNKNTEDTLIIHAYIQINQQT